MATWQETYERVTGTKKHDDFWDAFAASQKKTPYSDMFKNITIPTLKLDMSRKITNVIFNNPATIVFWDDGTKTVVKCQNNETFDPEKGLAMAIAKRFFDNKGSYFNQIKKWTEK